MAGTITGIKAEISGDDLDLTHFVGKTINFSLTFKDGGVAINLTGFTARMQVRESVDASDILAAFTTENGRIALGGVAGTIAITMSAADSATLFTSTGEKVYDLEVVSGGGAVYLVASGKFNLVGEVTR